jgi:hypothetical protein
VKLLQGSIRAIKDTAKILKRGWRLKVPKCEIFDRSDFHDFYHIKSLWEGDFGVKIKCFKKYI